MAILFRKAELPEEMVGWSGRITAWVGKAESERCESMLTSRSQGGQMSTPFYTSEDLKSEEILVIK